MKASWANSVSQQAPSSSSAAPTLPVPSRSNLSDPISQGQVAPRTDPNRDRLIQPGPIPTPTVPDPEEPLDQPPLTPDDTTPPEAPTTPIPVTEIEVLGSTIFGAKEFDPITTPLEGRSVMLEDLRQAADQITQLYLDQGYITSRAILVDQTITGGIVKIQVIEGSVEEIQVRGNRRVKAAYVSSRVGLGAKVPLNQARLEDQLRLLKADPLFTNVEASLRPGTQLGQSILIVQVTEAKSLSGLIQTDNFSPPSVGSVRLGGALSYRNITGYGDEFSISYFNSTKGAADTWDFLYRIPLNPMNGTLQLRFAPSSSRIIDPAFDELDITAENEVYEISFRQPLIRTPREEFALSLGFTVQDGQTFLFNDQPFGFGIGPDAEGNSKTRVLKFSQDYIRRDPQGAWALRSQFNFGLDIFNATENESPIPDGRFFSWLGQAQRVQRLGKDHLLIAQLDLQLTPDSLLPSQQFVIGGGQSVRGYRQNVRSGDNGVRLSVEDRISVYRDEAGIPIIQIAPFFDLGVVWNEGDNPNPLPDQKFIAGLGLGVIFRPIAGLNIRLDYAFHLVDLDDRGNDAQDHGVHFSVGYQF